MEQLPLFVYGTLRRGQCNHFLLEGNFQRRLPARLDGFARIHPLMIVRRAGNEVDGELYWLHADAYRGTLADCDQLEEVSAPTFIGRDYRRLRVRVSTAEGEFAAWAYVHAGTRDQAE